MVPLLLGSRRRGSGRGVLLGGISRPTGRCLLFLGRGRRRARLILLSTNRWLRRRLVGLEDASCRPGVGLGGLLLIAGLLTLGRRTLLSERASLMGGTLHLAPGCDLLRLRTPPRERRVGTRAVPSSEVDPRAGPLRTIAPYPAGEAVAYTLFDGPHRAYADYEGHRGGYEPLEEYRAPRQRRQAREPVEGRPHAAREVVTEVRTCL